MAALHFVDSEMARSGNEKISAAVAQQLHTEVVAFDTRLFPVILAAAQGPQSRRSHSLIYDPTSATSAILSLTDAQAVLLSRDIASSGSFLGEMVRISDIAWHVRVEAGAERRVMATLIAANRAPTPAELLHFALVRGRIEAPWEAIGKSVQDGVVPAPLAAGDRRRQPGIFRRLYVHPPAHP